MTFDAIWHPVRAFTLCTIFAALPGCTDSYKPSGQPSFYRSMATADAQLDAASAASMISGYRRNNGLNPVSLEPHLMRMAEAQARAGAIGSGHVASREEIGGGFGQWRGG
jgi:hypothetical protein